MRKFYFLLICLLANFSIYSQVTGTSTEVGITEGSLSVSLNGSASYSIPIVVPPGLNGVVPSIAIGYDSMAGNGDVGFGWNIAGVSRIVRVPSTKFHDNAIDPVDLDNLDRFALDGQRLLVKTGVYGAPGTVYETETFSNIKVTSIGTQSIGGPDYFKVQYPDGSFALYGNNANSKTVNVYAITYWENAQGVRINYTYNNTGNYLTVAMIKYGSVAGQDSLNTVYFNYLTRQRSEQMFVANQSVISSKILDEIVVAGGSGNFKRYKFDYETTSLGYQRLSKVTEKTGDGTLSLNPTVFSYDTTNNGSLFTVQTPTVLNFSGINYDNTSTVTGDFNGDQKIDVILYNKVGATDYWVYDNLQNGGYNSGTQHVSGTFSKLFPCNFLTGNSTTGFKLAPKQGWTVTNYDVSTGVATYRTYSKETGPSQILLQDTKTFTFPKFVYTTHPNWPCHIPATPYQESFMPVRTSVDGDFNGDGLTDILVFEEDAQYNVRQQCSGGSQIYQTLTYTGKVYFINLDKRLTSNFVNIPGTLTRNTPRELKTGDFNGDGKTDVYEFENGTIRVYGLSQTGTLETLTTYSDANIALNDGKMLGDFNGDGKLDWVKPLAWDSDLWAFYISTGTTFTKFVTPIGHPNSSSGLGYFGVVGWPTSTKSLREVSFIPTDINGDGKTDIIVQKNYTVECYATDHGCGYDETLGNPQVTDFVLLENKACTGNAIAFNVISAAAQYGGVWRKPIPMVTNYDRVNQNLEYSLISGNAIRIFNCQKDNKVDVLLKSITTGNGVKETITYKPLKNEPCGYNCNDVYTSLPNTEQYPNADIIVAPSIKVVTAIEKQSNGVYKKQMFSYHSAVANVAGLGFLGFRARMQTNWTDMAGTNLISTVTKNDMTLRGAPVYNFSMLGYYAPQNLTPTSNFIAKSVTLYNVNYTTNIVDPALQPNLVFKLRASRIEATNGLTGVQSITTSTFDTYNNPLVSTSTLKNGTVVEQLVENTMEYYDGPSDAVYYIGRPKSKTKKTTTYLPTVDVMESSELYQYQNHLLSQTKKNANGSPYLMEDNVYDQYGNITQKIIYYPGLVARETNYEYDLTTHRFLTKKIDVEGSQTIYDYDLNTGVLNSEINAHGQQTWYYYDKWFKKIQKKDYLSKTVNFYFTRASEKTTVSTVDADGSAIVELYDDLGRKIQSGLKDISGTFSYIDYVYDIYDRIRKTSEPHFGATTAPTQWNERQYDAYGRVIQNTSYTGKTQNISYNGFSETATETATSVSPPATVVKTKTSVKNAIGNTISVTDDGGTISYTYFANGNIKSSTINDATITMTQDSWGRKLSLTDSSAGTYGYTYNGYGELLTETTPKGTTTYSLDNFGKLSTKTVVGDLTDFTTTYTYDGTTKLLTNVAGHNNLTNQDYVNAFFYDGYKRLIKTTETNPQSFFEKQYGYDEFGRVIKEYYKAKNNSDGKVSDKWVRYVFVNGYKSELRDGGTTGDTNGALLRKINTVNARGQALTATSGLYVSEVKTYDAYGRPATTDFKVTSGPYVISPITPFLTLTTNFDQQTGRLSQRTNSMYAWTENFTYDNLDRLLTYKDAAGTVVSQSYESNGKIAVNNVGEYKYTTPDKPYQNTQIKFAATDQLLYYKARDPQIITYNALKKPVSITETGIEKIDFEYNASDTRTTMYYGDTQANKDVRIFRKFYSADGTMEIRRNLSNGSVEFVTYLGGDGYSAPVCLKSDGATQSYLYLHRDYQGSILAITSSSGQVLEKRMYDAWGAIIKYSNLSVSTVPTTEGVMLLDRGYTGHEHLLGVGLINMNARLYDPKLHRFLSPDNLVQQPDNTQSYNRYAYCVNNPLMYTDVTGDYFVIDDIIAGAIGGLINLGVNLANGNIDSFGEGLAAFGAGAAAGVLALYPEFGGWAAGGVIVGGTNAWLAGGDVLEGAVMGGVTSVVGGAIGSWATGAIGSILVNGMTISSPVLTGVVVGSLSGAASGAITGFGFALITGSDFSQAIESGWDGMKLGFVTGGISGGIGGYGKALKNGIDPWDGSMNGHPLNDGLKGTPAKGMLEPGKRIDRYGKETGMYASPEGTPFGERSLHATKNVDLHIYEVMKPLPMEYGEIAPYYFQRGGGTQYKFYNSMEYLVKEGFLNRIN